METHPLIRIVDRLIGTCFSAGDKLSSGLFDSLGESCVETPCPPGAATLICIPQIEPLARPSSLAIFPAGLNGLPEFVAEGGF